MEAVLKTREVSEQLGVNPTTVQRWVKHFNIHCELNEQGHYLFSIPQVEALHEIKGQLKLGKKLKDIQIGQFKNHDPKDMQYQTEEKKAVPTEKYEQELDVLLTRIEILEGKLAQKADEVVSYQISCQRQEIDQMMTMLKQMEEKISKMELRSKKEAQKPEIIEYEEKKPKKRSFIKMFSL